MNLQFNLLGLSIIQKISCNIPDVVSSDAKRLQVDGVSVFDDHLDGFEVSVHSHVDAGDGAVNLGPVLQLNRDRLVGQFHQKSVN